MKRLIAVVVLLVACSAVPAVAQQGNDPFGPLPQAPPAETPTPTPPPSVEAQQDTDRRLLFGIAGALLILFIVIARVITRDARKTVHATGHDQPEKPRDQGPHKHARHAKAKARAKTRAQRRARRQNR